MFFFQFFFSFFGSIIRTEGTTPTFYVCACVQSSPPPAPTDSLTLPSTHLLSALRLLSTSYYQLSVDLSSTYSLSVLLLLYFQTSPRPSPLYGNTQRHLVERNIKSLLFRPVWVPCLYVTHSVGYDIPYFSIVIFGLVHPTTALFFFCLQPICCFMTIISNYEYSHCLSSTCKK